MSSMTHEQRAAWLVSSIRAALWTLDNGPNNPNGYNSAAACLPGDGHACEPLLDSAIHTLRRALEIDAQATGVAIP